MQNEELAAQRQDQLPTGSQGMSPDVEDEAQRKLDLIRKSRAFEVTKLALRPGILVEKRMEAEILHGQEHYQGQLQELKKTMVGDVQRLQECCQTAAFPFRGSVGACK